VPAADLCRALGHARGAFHDEQHAGGAVVAWRTPGLRLLQCRDDGAVLLDIRIEAGLRDRGLSSQLFAAACAWAQERYCRQLLAISLLHCKKVAVSDVAPPAKLARAQGKK